MTEDILRELKQDWRVVAMVTTGGGEDTGESLGENLGKLGGTSSWDTLIRLTARIMRWRLPKVARPTGRDLHPSELLNAELIQARVAQRAFVFD